MSINQLHKTLWNDRNLALLQQHPLFESIGEAELPLLLNFLQAQVLYLAKGTQQRLPFKKSIPEGSPFLWLILKGKLDWISSSASSSLDYQRGDTAQHCSRTSGSVLGLSSCVQEGGQVEQVLLARSESIVLEVPVQKIFRECGYIPAEIGDVFRAFSLNLNHYLLHRLYLQQQRMEIGRERSIRKKILKFLLNQKARSVQEEGYKQVAEPELPRLIDLDLSREAWAYYLHVARPNLLRELKKLEAEGILSFEKNCCILHKIC